MEDNRQRSITYKTLKKDSLIVYGNKAKYQRFMRNIGGRWNSRIRGSEPGWVIPSSNEEILKAYINKVDPQPVLNTDDNTTTTTENTATTQNTENLDNNDTSASSLPQPVDTVPSVTEEESQILSNLDAALGDVPPPTQTTQTTPIEGVVNTGGDVLDNASDAEGFSEGSGSVGSHSSLSSLPSSPPTPKPSRKDVQASIKRKLEEKLKKNNTTTHHTLASLSKRNNDSQSAQNASAFRGVSPDQTYDCFTFYKIFKNKPSKFRKIFYNEDDGDSEIEEESSSDGSYSSDEEEDDMYKYLPKPRTPVKHKKTYNEEEESKTIGDIVKNMKKLQKQMYDLQINAGTKDKEKV